MITMNSYGSKQGNDPCQTRSWLNPNQPTNQKSFTLLQFSLGYRPARLYTLKNIYKIEALLHPEEASKRGEKA